MSYIITITLESPEFVDTQYNLVKQITEDILDTTETHEEAIMKCLTFKAKYPNDRIRLYQKVKDVELDFPTSKRILVKEYWMNTLSKFINKYFKTKQAFF